MIGLDDIGFLGSLAAPPPPASGGLSLLATLFDDVGNSLYPGYTTTRTFNVPAGTTCLVVGVNHSMDSATGYQSCTVDGLAATLLTSAGNSNNFSQASIAWAITGNFSGDITLTIGTRGSNYGGAHIYVWCLSGADPVFTNWRAVSGFSSSGVLTHSTASLTPTEASGIVLGGSSKSQTAYGTTLNPIGFDAEGYNETTADSTNTRALGSTWGSRPNTSITPRAIGSTSDSSTASRMGSFGIWVPEAP